MANPINHATQSKERTYEQIRPYLPNLFQRLGLNYAILIITVVLINTLGVALLLALVPIPQSTATAIGFAVNLLIFLYAWRILEKRNHATALFVLYSLYSRQRRDLKASIALAEKGTLEDDDALYVQVDLLEEQAKSFLDAVEEQGLKAHQTETHN